jgi:tetratricopeptide (TPR) repeat protein
MPEDVLFQEAVAALKQGNTKLARDKLTFLLKAEQNNPTYWIWMSAAVETGKERIYCLQTASKLEPQNATAQRGLVVLGALPPDENVQPFSINRPRAWEGKLRLAVESPGPAGVQAVAANPLPLVAGLGVVGIALCGLGIVAVTSPRQTAFAPPLTNTPGPSPTASQTPTFINAVTQQTPTHLGPTPLWMLLPATYTPTPLYVNTPRAAFSLDQYNAALSFYEAGDFEAYVDSMRELERLEPEAADIHYYVGEAYRLQGLHTDALAAYNRALQVDPDFGAAYLGLARARLMQDPNASLGALFDAALDRDPNFGEIYLERANYFFGRREYESALVDLNSAEHRMPDSALVQLAYARTYLAVDDSFSALETARQANQIDLTLLEAYLVLGEAAVLEAENLEAIEALETYIVYEPKDPNALALLGEAYFRLAEYNQTVGYLNQAIPLLSFGRAQTQSYLYRGLAYLELERPDRAIVDLKNAYDLLPDSFELNIGLARAYYMQQEFGNAYLKAETTFTLATTNGELAQVYYWRALSQEKRAAYSSAIRDWNALLALPAAATSPELRIQAQTHLLALLAATPTPRGGRTAVPTRTPTLVVIGTRIATRTATSTATPTRTATLTSTATP